MKQLFSFCCYTLALIIPLWLIGFVVFVLYVFSFHFTEIHPSEAIVAWTGGEYRIQTAINLLEQHQAEKLLISGVNKAVTPNKVLKELPTETRVKIDLGYQATTTKENAIETRDWIKKHKISSILLVTSFYHMPRSLIELKHVIPNIDVVPVAIWPKYFTESVAWLHTRSAFHLLNEYHKFLIVKLQYFLEGLVL